MQKIITNKEKENKKYYKNVLVTMKNTNNITSLGCIISCNKSGNYSISIRFYKIYSFLNEISLENINKIIKNKFPHDIKNKILEYYLRNNISFISIKEDKKNKKYNTLKITANINYCDNKKVYETFINKPTIDEVPIKNNLSIINKISTNFENLLNNRISFDIDEIFNIHDNEIDECVIHNIHNCSIGWGIYI